jgi:cyclophilin family peptidyl-prolyl cis-trans isomerase/FKBP-type peptidyl-prolyl cis-trans isomerase 2
MTTTNFIALSKKWYYNDVIFHRVIKDFMIQWWDPDGTGMGWKSIYWEKFDDEFNQNLKNNKYSISMANSGPNTNWSQFFINQNNNNHLDNKHSVFWQVVEWEENIDKIAKIKTDQSDKPLKEIKIINIEIKEYQNWILKDYEFDLDSTLKQIEEKENSKNEDKKDKIIKKLDTVFVHYTWKFEDWTKFDSSLDRWEPIEFQVWSWMMIPWFDAWVVGLKIWDKKTLTLLPAEAYWKIDKTKVQEIPKTELKSFTDAWIELKIWVKLPTQMWELEIIEVTEETVKINVNHPMAWKTLIFDIEIIDIK